SIGQLAGAGAGGFLYAVGRFLPFLVDAVTHAVALVALAFARIPPRPPAPAPRRHLAREMAEGVAWVWRQRDIRVTTGVAVALNLFLSGFYVVVLVLARAPGCPGRPDRPDGGHARSRWAGRRARGAAAQPH